eukprot:GILK01001334.1.p1 GENE.GILK01001334.1~~GILK01001334.1.p1  ORF type:complete len:383 (-),score=64.49 GILK01001334.1:103-1251(-)
MVDEVTVSVEMTAPSQPPAAAASDLNRDAPAHLLHLPFDLSQIVNARKADVDLAKEKKHVKAFYEQQNSIIDCYLQRLDFNAEDQDLHNSRVKIAVNGSLMLNVALFCLQITAAVSSSSDSIIATAVDSFMDVLTGLVLVLASHSRHKKDYWKYPAGKARMEPVSIVVFATLMGAVAVELIVTNVTSLISGTYTAPDVSILTIALIVTVIATKFCMMLYCASIPRSASAATLTQDHRNDLSINGFGIGMALLGTKVLPWLDPMGGIIIALLILRSWIETAAENFQLLVGKKASNDLLKRLTLLALAHHPQLAKVDTVRAFHMGQNLYAEVDIMLHPDTPLQIAHDVGESLQKKIELIPDVERAFVHIDFETAHKPDSEHKQL